MESVNVRKSVEEMNKNFANWNLETEDLSCICYSKCFYIEEKDNVFCLELSPINEGYMSLSVRQKQGRKLPAFYLTFKLEYENKFKYFLRLINNKNTRKDRKTVNTDGRYEIKTIKTSSLTYLRCIAEYYTEFDDKDCESESDDEDTNYKLLDNKRTVHFQEGDGDRKESNSKTLKEEEKVHQTKTDSYRQRGEIALIEKLRDTCLSEEDSDIILNVRDQKFPAHKVIIRALSPVFHRMLTHDMKEKNQGCIDIPDCDPSIFRDFLRYLYTGKSDNITDENAFELYYMSDKYDVQELKMDSIDYISDNLSVNTICDAIALATRHSEYEMLKQATKFFVENAKTICLTSKWQIFMKEYTTEANELILKSFDYASKKQYEGGTTTFLSNQNGNNSFQCDSQVNKDDNSNTGSQQSLPLFTRTSTATVSDLGNTTKQHSFYGPDNLASKGISFGASSSSTGFPFGTISNNTDKKTAAGCGFSFGAPTASETNTGLFPTSQNMNTLASLNFGAASEPAGPFQFVNSDAANKQSISPADQKKIRKAVRGVNRKYV